MTTEQRRALADTIPTTEVVKDAVTFPRDRLGEPLDISAERFEAWLARVRRDAARRALNGLAMRFERMGDYADLADQPGRPFWEAQDETEEYRNEFYPAETP